MGSKQLATIISLGCAKNLVDSETMAAQLLRLGYTMTKSASEASLIVVNTCGFLQSAVEEAIDTILTYARFKSEGTCETLVVAGCMVQRYGKKLPKLLPEVDLFLGTSHYLDLGKALEAQCSRNSRRIWIGRPGSGSGRMASRLLPTPAYSTYLRIADGCSNRCAYCMIPRLRGPYRSRTLDDVVREAAELVAQGAIEINVIAQDTTAFGMDRGDDAGLLSLIEEIENLQDLKWARILYTYPQRVDERLLSVMRSSSKVVPYLDMPIQHCSARILKAMGRSGGCEELSDKIRMIRDYLPDASLRTSLMVGFPGETDKDFQVLMDFVEAMQVDHVGVFAFSPERGARAALFPGQVEEEIKRNRRQILLEAQQRISRKRLSRFVGREMDVLIEGAHPETELLLCGRTAHQAPEVDGMVMITDGVAALGEIRKALATDSHDYDLVARLI
ncbi:MAG: 30S ribosomal protein S12 methylthiotransferase RimO [Syntrophobacteraceae bacterium]